MLYKARRESSGEFALKCKVAGDLKNHRLFSLRPRPHHARKALERDQALAEIRPLLQLLDRDVIKRLAARAIGEERARNIDHCRRMRAFVSHWRAAALAKASDAS